MRFRYIIGIQANDNSQVLYAKWTIVKLFLLNGILVDMCEENCQSRSP